MNKTLNDILASCLSIMLVAILFLLLSGCGYQRTLRSHCHIGDTQTCDNLFGVNQAEIDERQDAEINSLTTMITELVKDVREVEASADQQQQTIDLLHVMAQQQGANITAINQMLAGINQNLVTIQSKIAYETQRINGLAIDVANLQAQDAVVETVYPCGQRANRFDEAFLKMKSGKLIAYFENGGARHLSLLNVGDYRTTDSAPYCYFTVSVAGQIVNARRQ